jgi:hypothetical protein
MKKLIIATLGIVALSFSSFAWSTPVYSGNTVANFASNVPGTATAMDPGYYIWSDETHTNWSVRWTGSGAWYDWFGTIELTNLVDGSIAPVLFEASHPDTVNGYFNVFGTDQDFITLTGYAGPGWDGFDFSIDTSVAAVVDWELGSSAFGGLTPAPAAQASVGIFIGQEFNTPLVQVQARENGSIVQRFETVPEPAALLLMASGLIAVGAARIRRRS